MNPVQVTARTNLYGKIIPLRFEWDGQVIQILSVGRRWLSDKGEHILVMIPGDRVVELLCQHNMCWSLKRIPALGKRWFV